MFLHTVFIEKQLASILHDLIESFVLASLVTMDSVLPSC